MFIVWTIPPWTPFFQNVDVARSGKTASVWNIKICSEQRSIFGNIFGHDKGIWKCMKHFCWFLVVEIVIQHNFMTWRRNRQYSQIVRDLYFNKFVFLTSTCVSCKAPRTIILNTESEGIFLRCDGGYYKII